MAKPKKRAPGGGRKPQGEFDQLTSMFAVRMPRDIREQLEAAAKKNRRSTGQELLRRLYDSFGISDKHRNSALRAICFLISEVADRIIYASPKSPWQNNKFLFRGVKVGIAKLLDELEPKGDMPPSPGLVLVEKYKESQHIGLANHFARVWKSPQSIGNDAASRTLSDLYRGPDPRVAQAFKTLAASEDKDVQEEASLGTMLADRTRYGMEQVGRDLGITKQEIADAKAKRPRKTKL